MADNVHEQILEQLGDAVLLADGEGIIRLWNASCVRLFGWTADEAIGQTLDLIVPERQRDRHWSGYDAAMERGSSRYGAGDVLAVPALRKDGSRTSVEFTVAILKDDDGRVTGIAACLRDVSAKREQEQALRRRIAELEQQTTS